MCFTGVLGGGRGGYCTSEKFMSNIFIAYPPDCFTVCWFFDHSSCHKAFPDDALDVKKVNVHPGGAQAIMHATEWGGRPQLMVDENGIAKGMKAILEERGINTAYAC